MFLTIFYNTNNSPVLFTEFSVHGHKFVQEPAKITRPLFTLVKPLKSMHPLDARSHEPRYNSSENENVKNARPQLVE